MLDLYMVYMFNMDIFTESSAEKKNVKFNHIFLEQLMIIGL